MVFERNNGLRVSASQYAERIEPVSIESISSNHSSTDDGESPQPLLTIEDGAQMSNPSLFTPPPPSHPLQRSHSRNSVLIIDDDSSLSESPSVVEITDPKPSSVKNNVHPSQRSPIPSKLMTTRISSPQSPSTFKPRVRAKAGPSTNRAIYRSFPTAPPRSRSGRPLSTSINDKPSVAKKPKTHHHAPLDANNTPNPKSQPRPSPPAILEASTSRADPEDLPIFEYDLDRDPTEEVHRVFVQFHERSIYSIMLSARFTHIHPFLKSSSAMALNDELADREGDLVTEFIEPAAIGSVGPHHGVTPSCSVTSAEALGNSHLSPGSGDLDLEGTIHDPFAVMTMDDIINQPSAINPSLLGGAPAFSEPRSPSPAPTPFRNLHLRMKPPTPLPHLTQPSLTIRVPSRTPTSGPNSAGIHRDIIGNPSGGKAKFYKKGTLQTPPHLSNSQSRRSRSAKAAPSTHSSRFPTPDQIICPDSPLTEFSGSGFLAAGTASTSSIDAFSEVANTVDEEFAVISSGSSAQPPRVAGTKKATPLKQKRADKGPHRTTAVNESIFCHQCRNKNPYPKMHCCNCTRSYCIMCIVKRYHDIEFQQFKKDFDCPACLNKCNCTYCCERRREVYVTTRHIKFDAETRAKLLSGETRSLPHLSAKFAGPRKGLKHGQDRISSGHREFTSTTSKVRTSTRRKRAPNRRYISDDDYGDDDYEDDDHDHGGTAKVQSASVRVKPAQAALQTQRMLEESGSGRYWGAVYSLNGERVGMSYVGNNLQDVTVQTGGFSSASTGDRLPFQRRRVYVGRWQDSWGPRQETSDDSHSEGETHTRKRGRNRKEFSRARSHYVGNLNLIKTWRRAQSKTIRSPSAAPLPLSDGFDVHTLSSSPLPLGKACDGPEAADASPDLGTLIDEEDELGSTGYWTMEDGLWPKEMTPLFAPTNISGPILGNVDDALDVCPASTLEFFELTPQQVSVEVVASSLEAAGAAVFLPQTPLPLPPLNY